MLAFPWQWYGAFLREFEPKIISRLRRGYSLDLLKKDAAAGISVAVVAFPLAMALAVASGATPDRGFATTIIGGLLVALLSGSRTQIAGPVAAFAIIIHTVIQQHGYDGLLLATLIAGVLLVFAGFARLGAIIRYIPYSVITGFTTALAFIIFTLQVRDLLGLPLDTLPPGFLDKWKLYWKSLPDFHVDTTIVAACSVAAILLLRKYKPRVPVLITVVAVSSLVVWLLGLDVTTISTKFGNLPSQLPTPRLPTLSLAKVIQVFPAALTIAFLAGIEALLCAVIADGMTGDRHRSNMELVAQGVANVVTPLFCGLPVTATFARTVTNIKAGAQTPISGVVYALVSFFLMTFFVSLVGYIPMATLAAILLVVAWDMSAFNKFFNLLRTADNERLVLGITFLLTILVDLTIAIQAGIIASSFFFVHRMSRLTNITPLEDSDEIAYVVPEAVRIYYVHGPFFFGAASRIKHVLDQQSKKAIYILNLENMPLIDATGVHVLTHFIDRCKRQGALVILSGLNPQPLHTLKRMGADNIVPLHQQTTTLEEALRLAHILLGITEPVLADKPVLKEDVPRVQAVS